MSIVKNLFNATQYEKNCLQEYKVYVYVGVVKLSVFACD